MFFQKQRINKERALLDYEAGALVHSLRAKSEVQRQSALELIKEAYCCRKAEIEVLNQRLNLVRNFDWRLSRFTATLVSSLFGLAAKYAYEQYMQNEDREHAMLINWAVGLTIGCASITLHAFLQNTATVDMLEAKIEKLSREADKYEKILVQFQVDISYVPASYIKEAVLSAKAI